MNSLRRGACPGLSDPMPTGDGLLARLIPSAPIPLDDFVELCEASRAHGNGIMEVTQRGSLQVRGLSPMSAPAFAEAVTALGLGSNSGPPVLTSPLLGLDAEEGVDLRPLAAALRGELSDRSYLASVGPESSGPESSINPQPGIGPKVSVLIDGGGALHLDELPADLRLRMGSASRLHLSIAGTAEASMSLGWVEPQDAVRAVVHVLAAIAKRGAGARARDLANADGVSALRASLAAVLTDEPRPPPRPPAEPIGRHRLKDERVARGIALAFGYAEAHTLERLARAAARYGAASIRPAPGRALLVIGLTADAAEELAGSAMSEGFVVKPDDVRRHVAACAGAPACKSATLATRELARGIAEAAGPLLDGSATVHLSGCAKGCAHPGAAALTLVGPDRLVVRGRAGDAPQGTITPANFVAGLRRLYAEGQPSLADLVGRADFLSRLGAVPVAQVRVEEPGRD